MAYELNIRDDKVYLDTKEEKEMTMNTAPSSDLKVVRVPLGYIAPKHADVPFIAEKLDKLKEFVQRESEESLKDLREALDTGYEIIAQHRADSDTRFYVVFFLYRRPISNQAVQA